MAKQRLTTGEMEKVHQRVLVVERHNHPGADIEVGVYEETDENGDPRYWVKVARDRVISRSGTLI
jgi:hypothetical protein